MSLTKKQPLHSLFKQAAIPIVLLFIPKAATPIHPQACTTYPRQAHHPNNIKKRQADLEICRLEGRFAGRKEQGKEAKDSNQESKRGLEVVRCFVEA